MISTSSRFNFSGAVFAIGTLLLLVPPALAARVTIDYRKIAAERAVAFVTQSNPPADLTDVTAQDAFLQQTPALAGNTVFLAVFRQAVELNTNATDNSGLFVDTAGRVGIGTTAPGEKLEVNGNIKLSSAGISSGVRALTPTGWGYSPNYYRVLQVGASSGNETVAIGYDPSGNSNGAFTGDGREVLFRNGVQFVTPNAANNAFNLYNLVLKDGNVGIGTTSPSRLLYLKKTSVSNPGYNPLLGLGYDDTEVFGGTFGMRVVSGNPRQGLKISSNLNFTFHSPVSTGNPAFQWQTGTVSDESIDSAVAMTLTGQGNVGIGTTNPTQKLSVNGTIQAKEVIVQTGWSDYVFTKGYRLAPLSEIEQQIEKNGHLPGMPSAQEVADHGVSMGEMQSKLLAKIEELTLHQIEQEKRQREQESRAQEQQVQIKIQREEIGQLRAALARVSISR